MPKCLLALFHHFFTLANLWITGGGEQLWKKLGSFEIENPVKLRGNAFGD